jgi:hypothetical protein
MFKVTVYSMWEKTHEHFFDTQEEADVFAEEMKNQQYQVIVEEEEEKEL